MELELKNGQIINLDWNPIVLEYLSDYNGGIKQMQQDIKNKNNLIYIANHLAYSVISANIDNQLSFKEVMKLISPDDVDKILDFIIKNCNQFESNTTHVLKH
jgi:hypothetical protein